MPSMPWSERVCNQWLQLPGMTRIGRSHRSFDGAFGAELLMSLECHEEGGGRSMGTGTEIEIEIELELMKQRLASRHRTHGKDSS